jgi:hypothetical protein
VDDKVKSELKHIVREKIAPFAMPDYIQVRPPEGSFLNGFSLEQKKCSGGAKLF